MADNNYLIVEFPEEQDGTGAASMAIISSSWVLEEDGCLYCNWPSYFRTDLLKDKAVQNHMPLIQDKCVKCPILIKFTTELITEVLRQLKIMKEDTSYLIKLYINNTEKQVSSGEVAKIDSFEELSKLNDDLSGKTTFADWCCKLQYIGGKMNMRHVEKFFQLS